MIYRKFKDIELSTLGMGNMRLPHKPVKDEKGELDWEESSKIIDYAIENGVNYFDTAHVYNNTESEACLGYCLKKHDRSKFYIATKFNIGACKDYKGMFEAQLERLQTDYIDFYLIHCILDNNIDEYLTSGAVEYFLEQQKLGRIKYLGFSSHAGVATLTRFVDHHAWDFAQLQVNYYDWMYGSTQAEYKVLEERNIPLVVMEPVRGGRLAELTQLTEAMLKEAHPEWTIPSWALRFVRSLPNVHVVLSGMSTMDQIIDNVKTFADDTPFTEEDKALLLDVCEKFHDQIVVPCTGCRYCTDGCPMQINIPEFLKIYNSYKTQGGWALHQAKNVETEGQPGDCIGCGACMGHCPQSIQIPDYLHLLAEALEKM